MARQRSFLGEIQRDAYWVSRAAGDLRAIQRGRYVRRVVRRRATRGFFSELARIFR
jgi:hypothetical protein